MSLLELLEHVILIVPVLVVALNVRRVTFAVTNSVDRLWFPASNVKSIVLSALISRVSKIIQC